MTWDPAATQALIVMAGIIGVVAFVAILKSRRPESPPAETVYSRATWGQVLKDGEAIEAQVPVDQPVSWLYRQFFNGPFARWNTPRQLALTSGGALLVAEREPGNLSDRRRYEIGSFRVENVKSQGEYCVSLRLVISDKRVNLHGVPRAFLERLRSRGIDVSASLSV
jgi:hypothetical protein